MIHQFGRHGAYWRCPLCNYTCNENGTAANWDQIVSNYMQNFYTLCSVYQNTLIRDITINSDPIQSIILIQKCQQEFDSSCSTIQYQLASFRSRPNLQPYFQSMDSAYANTYWQLSKACMRIGRYHNAAQYIAIAVHYINTQDQNRVAIFSTQSEILARIAAISSSDIANQPLQIAAKNTTSCSNNDTDKSINQKESYADSQLQTNNLGCLGCLKYFLISLFVVIVFIALASCGQENSKKQNAKHTMHTLETVYPSSTLLATSIKSIDNKERAHK